MGFIMVLSYVICFCWSSALFSPVRCPLGPFHLHPSSFQFIVCVLCYICLFLRPSLFPFMFLYLVSWPINTAPSVCGGWGGEGVIHRGENLVHCDQIIRRFLRCHSFFFSQKHIFKKPPSHRSHGLKSTYLLQKWSSLAFGVCPAIEFVGCGWWGLVNLGRNALQKERNRRPVLCIPGSVTPLEHEGAWGAFNSPVAENL